MAMLARRGARSLCMSMRLARAPQLSMTRVHLYQPSRGFAAVQAEREPDPSRPHQSVDEVAAVAHAKLRAAFKSGRTRSYEWRMEQLKGIRQMMVEQKDPIIAAIHEDLGRAHMESLLGEIVAVLGEIDFAMSNLQAWMKPEAVSTPLMSKPGHSKVVREPKGVILVMAPWNFPIQLSLIPVVQAIAAGNCVLLKPSEVSRSSEKLMAELLPKYMDPSAFALVIGGVPETTALLQLRWDHIVYTGNGMVGRIVYSAAAKHLTPVTLELGGKSPAMVLPGADIPVIVRRLLSTKFYNTGQFCIAPDYALVHESLEQQFAETAQTTLRAWYGEDASTSPDFGRIINDHHFRRVKMLIESSDGETWQQGTMDEATRFIPPTMIRGPSATSPVMQQEIFGPILPVLKMRGMDDMIEHINAGDKPLAMYIFGPEKDAQEIIARTSSGGVCVNDTLMQITNPNLPFGGVGESGVGKYHGKFGFDEFSHQRAVMVRATWPDAAARYPPYTEENLRTMEKLLLRSPISPTVKRVATAVAAATVAAMVAGMAVR